MNTRKTSRILALVLGGGMLLSAVDANAAFRWPWEKRSEDKRPAPTAPAPQRNPGNPLPTKDNPLPNKAPTDKTTAQREDMPMLQKLHEMNLAQVEMAELAVRSADDNRVKKYAQSLLADHRQADRAIRDRAKTLGMNLREERNVEAEGLVRRQVGRLPGKMKRDVEPQIERTKGVDELADLNGPAFDVTYLDRSMELYDVIRREFAEFKSSESGEFQNQLSTQFDKLVKHRDHAKKLHDEIRNENRQEIKDVKGTDAK